MRPVRRSARQDQHQQYERKRATGSAKVVRDGKAGDIMFSALRQTASVGCTTRVQPHLYPSVNARRIHGFNTRDACHQVALFRLQAEFPRPRASSGRGLP